MVILDAVIFRNALVAADFAMRSAIAASQDPTKDPKCGVLLVVDDRKVTLTATDGSWLIEAVLRALPPPCVFGLHGAPVSNSPPDSDVWRVVLDPASVKRLIGSLPKKALARRASNPATITLEPQIASVDGRPISLDAAMMRFPPYESIRVDATRRVAEKAGRVGRVSFAADVLGDVVNAFRAVAGPDAKITFDFSGAATDPVVVSCSRAQGVVVLLMPCL